MDSPRTVTIKEAVSSADNDILPPWVILVVDDAQSVLDITCNVLKNFRFMDRGIQLECAKSAQEAKQLYRRYPDAAVILLDCAMERDTAGLDLIQFIRNEQDNHNIQIVLRTGQPGIAPEQKVLLNYAVNDYLSKAELSSSKLKNRIITYLRNYANIMLLEDQNRQLLADTQKTDNLLSTTNAPNDSTDDKTIDPSTTESETKLSLVGSDPLHLLGAKLREDIIIPFIAAEIFSSLFARYFDDLIQLSIRESSSNTSHTNKNHTDNDYTAIQSPKAYVELIALGRQKLDTFWSEFNDQSGTQRITLVQECIKDLTSIWDQIDVYNQETLLPTLPKLLGNYNALRSNQEEGCGLFIPPEHLDGLNNTADSCTVATTTAKAKLSTIETELVRYTTEKMQEGN